MSLDEPDDPASVYLTEVDAAILAAVVGHPFGLPTMRELRFAAGEFDAGLVERRVDRLVAQGVLETVAFDGGPPSPGEPDTFYGAAPLAESILDRRLEAGTLRLLREEYARLEKPPEIRECERAPRPPR